MFRRFQKYQIVVDCFQFSIYYFTLKMKLHISKPRTRRVKCRYEYSFANFMHRTVLNVIYILSSLKSKESKAILYFQQN